MKFRQGRFDEAAEWIAVGKEHTAVDDFDAQLLWMPVSAKVSARRGDLGGAIAMASDAAALAETTDGLNRRAVVQSDLVWFCSSRAVQARERRHSPVPFRSSMRRAMSLGRHEFSPSATNWPSSDTTRPAGRGPRGVDGHLGLAARRAGAACRRKQRSREREQADCEHDERAMHARDLEHGVPPLGFSGAPVTLGPTPNRPTTGG